MKTKIYIIESIDQNKGTNSFLAYADSLKKYISDNNSNTLITCESIKVNSKYQWNKVWQIIREDCKQGIRPIIHFIAHGTKDGLKIVGYKELPWRYVLQQIKRVNNLCNKELFITMNVCYGLHCMSELLKIRELPFNFLLASKDKVPAQVFNAIYISQNPFVIFYQTIIESSNVDEALNNFAEILPDVNQENHSTWCLIQSDNNMPFNLSIKIIKN